MGNVPLLAQEAQLNFLSRRAGKDVRKTEQPAELDFKNSTPDEFQSQLGTWRAKLESNADSGFDPSALKYLSPEAIKKMRSEKRRRTIEAKKAKASGKTAAKKPAQAKRKSSGKPSS